MSFSGLAGQDRALGVLRGALEKKRVPHGQLFLGPDAAVLRRAAAEFAKALFCEKGKTEPCGACVACSKVERGLHPDFHVAAPADDARAIKVEDARAMISQASLRPLEAPAKVFVVESASTMNDVTQNALLKTLEEPAPGTYFVLLSASADGLLPTLRSRLQAVTFAAGVSPEEDAEAEELSRQILEFMLYRANRSEDPYADAPDFSKEERQTLARALEITAGYFRDVLLLRAGAPDLLGDVRDRGEKERMAQLLDEDALIARIELLGETKERVGGTINAKLALGALWEGSK